MTLARLRAIAIHWSVFSLPTSFAVYVALDVIIPPRRPLGEYLLVVAAPPFVILIGATFLIAQHHNWRCTHCVKARARRGVTTNMLPVVFAGRMRQRHNAWQAGALFMALGIGSLVFAAVGDPLVPEFSKVAGYATVFIGLQLMADNLFRHFVYDMPWCPWCQRKRGDDE